MITKCDIVQQLYVLNYTCAQTTWMNTEFKASFIHAIPIRLKVFL